MKRRKTSEPKHDSKIWLWIGLGGGGVVLVGICGCIGVVWAGYRSIQANIGRPADARRLNADQLRSQIVGKWCAPGSKKTAYHFKEDGTVVGSFGGLPEFVCPYRIVDNTNIEVTVRFRDDLAISGVPQGIKNTYEPPRPDRDYGVHVVVLRYPVYITDADILHINFNSGPGIGYVRDNQK